MEKLNFYKKRIEAAIDEGIVDYKKEGRFKELVEKVIYGPHRYPRLVAALSLVNELMPEALSRQLAKKLDRKDFSQLPFNPEKLEFKEKIGAGYVSKVYLLEAKADSLPSYVLKLDFNKPGDANDLHKFVKQNQEDYERIKDYYRDLPDLIPEEESLLLTGRKDRKPVVATVQKFIGTNLKDVFNDYTPEELRTVMANNPALHKDLAHFTELSLAWRVERSEAVDLVGEKNLVVAEQDGRLVLKFLDPHLISSLASDDRERNKDLEKALSYLENICSQVSEQSEFEKAA